MKTSITRIICYKAEYIYDEPNSEPSSALTRRTPKSHGTVIQLGIPGT